MIRQVLTYLLTACRSNPEKEMFAVSRAENRKKIIGRKKIPSSLRHVSHLDIAQLKTDTRTDSYVSMELERDRSLEEIELICSIEINRSQEDVLFKNTI